jgi:hypothetical protein
LNVVEIGAKLPRLGLILPIGISFYTFGSMSYTIYVYRGRLRAVQRLRDFYYFVTFFPTWSRVRWAIERAVGLNRPASTVARRLAWYLVVQSVVMLAWIFLRSDGISHALTMIHNIVDLKFGALAGDILVACTFLVPLAAMHLYGLLVEKSVIRPLGLFEQTTLAGAAKASADLSRDRRQLRPVARPARALPAVHLPRGQAGPCSTFSGGPGSRSSRQGCAFAPSPAASAVVADSGADEAVSCEPFSASNSVLNSGKYTKFGEFYPYDGLSPTNNYRDLATRFPTGVNRE